MPDGLPTCAAPSCACDLSNNCFDADQLPAACEGSEGSTPDKKKPSCAAPKPAPTPPAEPTPTPDQPDHPPTPTPKPTPQPSKPTPTPTTTSGVDDY